MNCFYSEFTVARSQMVFISELIEIENKLLNIQAILQENNKLYEEDKIAVGKIKVDTKTYIHLRHLKSLKVESLFPNIEVDLRIFSNTAVTNCSGEKLLYVKIKQRPLHLCLLKASSRKKCILIK